MNALAPIPAALSPNLAVLVDDLVQPGPLGPRPLGQVDAATRREAGDAIPRADFACQSAGIDAVRQWLKPVAAAVRNPPTGQDFAARCELIAGLVPEAIRGALTPQTAREAVGRFQFWPAAADVAELLRPNAERLLGELRALRRIAEMPPPAPAEQPRGIPTDAERDAVSRAAAQARALLTREDGPSSADLPPVRARALSPNDLAAFYRKSVADGGPFAGAAATRLAMMERGA